MTQDPVADDYATFWAMIFQERVTCILMIEDKHDRERKDQEQGPTRAKYYPETEGEKKQIGRHKVENQLTGKFMFEHWVTALSVSARHLVVTKDGDPAPLAVTHLLIDGWPILTRESKPKLTLSLCELLIYLEDVKTILIHDDDGANRAGVVVLLKMLMDVIDIDPVKIWDGAMMTGKLRTLRSQRARCIGSCGQFQFCCSSLKYYHLHRYEDNERLQSWWPVGFHAAFGLGPFSGFDEEFSARCPQRP
ncbi:unnamed protein product, partial [Mesorhabditis spiculigera]